MLKHIIIALFLMGAINTTTTAQNLHSTKAAKIRFFSSLAAEDIEATNSQAVSKLDTKTGAINFIVLIKGFVFENELMQKHFNEEYMESTKFPKSEFKGLITNLSAINFSKNGSYPAIVSGSLSIRGISQPVKATGSIIVANGKISVKSIFKIKVVDFGITGSDIGKSIANELEITVTSQYD
ncbi:MAG: YceI family protein [Sediminibacterium sp.]|jgi:polyisoprenoid-binding protein YceI